jgi:hypothetical protein
MVRWLGIVGVVLAIAACGDGGASTTVPGGDHGVDLLSDENGPRVRSTILAFLDANAR